MKATLLLLGAAMLAGTAVPGYARVEDYGPRRYTAVGPHNQWRDHGHQWRDHDHQHETIIDRRGGPGWGGLAAAGILGAVAGMAIGGATAGPPPSYGPPPVEYGPPAVGTVVPALPAGCVSVPAYNGGTVFNCGGLYYQPFYEGYSLMYQVVPGP